MKDVMMKAQELAETILYSEIYQKMKQQEAAVRRDPEAAAVLGDMIEKRNRVETVLSAADMDPEELAKASEEMEAAEKRMNEIALEARVFIDKYVTKKAVKDSLTAYLDYVIQRNF